MMNGYVGLAAQNHADKTTELLPLWKGLWLWVIVGLLLYLLYILF